MKNSDKKLTSVKIDGNLLQAFKLECLRNKFSFQKLASRSIFLYLTDEDFRKKLHNTTNINIDE